MFFIGRNKYYAPGLKTMPFSLAVNFAFACMDEYFVLPRV